MLHLNRPAVRILTALAALSTPVFAQTYTARVGASIGASGDVSIASVPTEAFWDGSSSNWTRHASSRAEQGALQGTAYCATYALYNMQAYAVAEFEYDDVIFSSPGSAPIPVSLHLSIEGNASVVNGNSFGVTVKHGSQEMGSATLSSSGAVSSSSALSGWDMHSGHSFDRAMTVPVNTPVSVKIRLIVFAAGSAGGHNANGHYTLRFGGAFDPCGQYEVFDVPAGVTVNSVQASITDNLWAPSAVGVNYCVAATNSASAEGALMSATGSAEVSANDLVLRAGPIPAGETAVFFHGSTQIQAPFGEGFRCAGGQVVRLWPPMAADGTGFLVRAVDNTGSGGTAILAGVTRNFQLWYRDPAGGPAGFNFSDGLEVCFY